MTRFDPGTLAYVFAREENDTRGDILTSGEVCGGAIMADSFPLASRCSRISDAVETLAREMAEHAVREARGRFVQRVADVLADHVKGVDRAEKRYRAARVAVEADAGEDPDAAAHVAELRAARQAYVVITSKVEGLRCALEAIRGQT